MSIFPQVRFQVSVAAPGQFPPDFGWEVAIAGRSNAGKSSVINALLARKGMAKTSRTPGRTRLYNYFELMPEKRLVDLPGYGYADAPVAVRKHWEMLVGEYIASRDSLAAVVVVMDARHPLTALDRQLLGWLREAGRGTHVLLTKSDKLSKQASQVTLAKTRKELAAVCPGATVQLFSSLKSEGIDEANATLSRLAFHKNKAPPKGE